jgi:hypothetical protein
MQKNTRVFNQSRRTWMKHRQAAEAVDNCACAWVEFGVSVRDLNLSESIAARNKRAEMREPLPFAELPGVVFSLGDARAGAVNAERDLMLQANRFAASDFATVR